VFYTFELQPRKEELRNDWRRLRAEMLPKFVLFIKYYQGDKVKDSEMGRTCSMCWEDD
jgi:hypothetical protein